MFSNIGNLSFYLGISFIAFSILGLFFFYYVLQKDLMDESKLAKVIDLGKWVIGSVAIVLSGSIISDGFKEREQDVRELEFFDKYVATVTQADGIEQRWRLCEYFAAVSPAGEMRSAWENYQKIIEPDYRLYQSTKEKLNALYAKDSLDNQDKDSIKVLSETKRSLETSLVTITPESKVTERFTVYIQFGKTTGREAAAKMRNAINDSGDKFGFNAPGIEYIESNTTNEIRYFRAEDESAANALRELLANYGADLQVKPALQFSRTVKPGTLEVWVH